MARTDHVISSRQPSLPGTEKTANIYGLPGTVSGSHSHSLARAHPMRKKTTFYSFCANFPGVRLTIDNRVSIIYGLTMHSRALGKGIGNARAAAYRYCTFVGEVFDLMRVTCGPLRPCFGYS